MEPTTATTIERTLTRGILRGRYHVGSRLPTLRELAREFSVNPSTIQRVVARLEARGLVTARQGSGLRVNDPHKEGDLGLLPDWIEAHLDEPGRAAGLLAELLELRCAVVTHLMVKHRERLLARSAELGQAAAALLETKAGGAISVREADMAFAEVFLAAAGNSVAMTVFNAVGRVVVELPLVATAMYDEPERNVASMMAVIQALQLGEDGFREEIEGIIGEVDRHTVERFERLLNERGAARC